MDSKLRGQSSSAVGLKDCPFHIAKGGETAGQEGAGKNVAIAKRSLADMIAALPQYPKSFSFGADIDGSHELLLSDADPETVKEPLLRQWAARWQPCLFGRLAAKNLRGFGLDICWISESDIGRGDEHIRDKIQEARRNWKDRAAEGLSHGFLIMFNDVRLAYARSSQELVAVCCRVADLYLVEACPIHTDIIYTEAIPLKGEDGGWMLFKAGCNIFYSGAHRTLNHDRRVPGGLMISVNSPGHLANSLIGRKLTSSFESAVELMRDLALRSVGNGGIGSPTGGSTSWHHETAGKCPVLHGSQPGENRTSTKFYSALYHSDVFVPSAVTSAPKIDPDYSEAVTWPWLVIDYLTAEEFPQTHVNYGLFHGCPISEEARYFNPWLPRKATNAPVTGY